MHHARRSVRLRRSGTRSSSGSAKPAPRDLGKWALPQNPPNSSATSNSPPPNLPGLSKWAVPPPPPSPSASGSVSNEPSWNKWTRPTGPAQTPSTPSPSSSQASTSRPAPYISIPVYGGNAPRRPTAPAPSKWNVASPPPRSTSFTREAPPTPSTSRAPPATHFRRESAPHVRGGSQDTRRESAPRVRGGPQGTRRANPANTSVAREEAQGTRNEAKITDEEAKSTSGAETKPARQAEDFDEVEQLEVQSHSAPRARKTVMKAFHKDRGPQRTWGSQENNDVAEKGKEKEKRRPRSLHLKKIQVDVFIPSIVSVENLARLLNVRLGRLQRTMKQVGMEEQSNYDHILTAEYASLIAMEFNRNPVIDDEAAFDIYPPPLGADRSGLPLRPPIVTIMGHVDHGKTTLLDTLRSSSVAKGEAGGITQHIGAFSVPLSNPGTGGQRMITFLDTPGHAAFSAMRARGASVTDIVVLVVAADDGIMPQTREVLELVTKDSNRVGLVVAINKVDKPGADVGKVEKALLAEGVQLETFGGDIPVVHVSGLTGQGLPDLVETISAVAELQDIRAEQTGPIQGYVLESKVDKGLGPVATVLVVRGSLTPGTALISGLAHGKVRLLKSPSGQSLKAVLPGTAALVSGWKDLPKAGDEVLQGTEGDIKRALTNRRRKADIEATIHDAEAINESRRAERELQQKEAQAEKEGVPVEREVKKDEKKELRLIIKGDVSGTVEAVAGAVVGIGNHLAGVKVVAQGVGEVNESDVMRAKAVEGVIVAFSVNIPRAIKNLANSQGVKILESNIIYRLMDDVKAGVVGLIPPIIEKRVTGEATVLQVFDIHLKAKQIMKVAGCRVTNGVVEKKNKARVIRNGETVHEGNLETLKHLKKDITEASKGLECGMAFEGWDDLREGDMIQMYQEVAKPATL